jgi:hypothetical protein
VGSYDLMQRTSSRGVRRRRAFPFSAFCLGGFVFVSGIALVSASALAENIVTPADFTALPLSPTPPEIEWSENRLVDGSGAIGTGYGTTDFGGGDQDPNEQEALGLLVQTPFEIRDVPDSEINTDADPHVTAFFGDTLRLFSTDSSGGIPDAGGVVPFDANATGRLMMIVFPEPGTLVMLFAAVVGLGGYVWRKRRKLVPG